MTDDGSRDRLDPELACAALAAAGDVAYVWDVESGEIIWSARIAELFGPRGAEAVGNVAGFHSRLIPEDLLSRRQLFDAHVEHGDPFDCEYRIRLDNGEVCWLHDRGSVELTPTGEPRLFKGVLRIVTKRKQAEARLEFQANYDEQTGHYNRSRLRQALDHSIQYNQRYGIEGGYICVGIDKLSHIAEAYDSETANAMILALGQRLDRMLRSSDIVGRVDADTFGIVMGNCKEDRLRRVSDRVQTEIVASPIDTPNGPIHASVSVGGVIFPCLSRNAHEVMAAAERARDEAMEHGGTVVLHVAGDAIRSGLRRELEIGERVLQALDEGRLVFAYQPVVSADEGQVAYYECLLRMLDGDRVEMAGSFMPVVEKLGLTRRVDHYVLQRAIRDLAENPDITLAINVSALTAADRFWLRQLTGLVKGRVEIARRLIVEITETVAIQDLDESAFFVTTIRDLGCRVALDDFGSGFTSFRHLKALTVDIVKIDGSFVRDLSRSFDNQLFIKTLLGLANGFGLSTVAECVETAQDAEMLSSQGVAYLQGYYFGRPSIEPPWPRAASSGQGTSVA